MCGWLLYVTYAYNTSAHATRVIYLDDTKNDLVLSPNNVAVGQHTDYYDSHVCRPSVSVICKNSDCGDPRAEHATKKREVSNGTTGVALSGDHGVGVGKLRHR